MIENRSQCSWPTDMPKPTSRQRQNWSDHNPNRPITQNSEYRLHLLITRKRNFFNNIPASRDGKSRHPSRMVMDMVSIQSRALERRSRSCTVLVSAMMTFALDAEDCCRCLSSLSVTVDGFESNFQDGHI